MNTQGCKGILITDSSSGLGQATAKLSASKACFGVRDDVLSGFRNGDLGTPNGTQLPLGQLQLGARFDF